MLALNQIKMRKWTHHHKQQQQQQRQGHLLLLYRRHHFSHWSGLPQMQRQQQLQYYILSFNLLYLIVNYCVHCLIAPQSWGEVCVNSLVIWLNLAQVRGKIRVPDETLFLRCIPTQRRLKAL